MALLSQVSKERTGKIIGLLTALYSHVLYVKKQPLLGSVKSFLTIITPQEMSEDGYVKAAILELVDSMMTKKSYNTP